MTEKTMTEYYIFDDILLYNDELYYENGELIKKEDFKHPVSGVFRAFYKNGSVCLEINFADNKKNGATKYYSEVDNSEDGANPIWINYYTDDKLNGIAKVFYSNGKIKREETFVMGKKEGIFRIFDEEGNIEKEIMYKNNLKHGFARKYYSNGQISSEAQFVNGKQVGTSRNYYKTGELESDKKEKDKIEYYYYKTGEIWSKVSINPKNNKNHGQFEDYYKNGKIQRIGFYKNGKFDGKIVEYYKNGKIEAEFNYKNGKKNGEQIAYYKNGHIQEIGCLKNGIKHGKFIKYYKNGVLKCEYNLKNDLRDGYSTFYNKNGEIISKALFKKGKLVNKLGKIGVIEEEIEEDKKEIKKPKKVCNSNYRLDFVNCSRNLEELTEKIINSKRLNFSICIHGEPGTGKSAYAHYLAEKLGLKIIKKSAADILDEYVGKSEQKIDNAFREASENKAMLVIDEVDSFLRSRGFAQRNWEVTVVNQILTSMEEFNYPFICTTNYIDMIDSASLRRFTFKFKFGFLKEEKIEEAFEYIFNQKPNSKILKMHGLTVSDFVSAKKECDILNIDDVDEIAKMLDEIVSYKKSEELRTNVGFN